MKKALIVLTNQETLGNRKEATGLWLSEAADFIKEITDAGIGVDYVSPSGGYVPIDPASLQSNYVSDANMDVYKSEDFTKRALANSLPANAINPDDYFAIYYTGGHGVMWDYPDNKDLQNIAKTIYENHGYVASVCHGVVGLLNIKLTNGKYLINNKKITGFTDTEELLSGRKKYVPFLAETAARKRGAVFVNKLPFSSFAVIDGNLITGQNPRSAKAVAKLLLQAIKK